jgi:hypothetical protein
MIPAGELVISPKGEVRLLYSETLDVRDLGDVRFSRASHVEPDGRGAWWADLSPVSGPTLGPFARRSQALQAEAAWLSEHWLYGA